jgi:hypothetical protein
MAERDSPPRVDPNRVAEIVSSYVRHHQIAADQLAGLIVEVHRALASLERAPPVQEPPRPAVPIRRSVQQDYIGHRQLVALGQLNLRPGNRLRNYCQPTLQISAQILNFWVLEALCSAAVT